MRKRINQFGTLLYTYISDQLLERKEIAEQLNISEGCLSHWITGKRYPHAKTIHHVRRVLELTDSQSIHLLDALIEDSKNKILQEYSS